MVILNLHGVGVPSRALSDAEQASWLEMTFVEELLDLAVRYKKTTILTVDDGNDSDLAHLLPALLQRGLQAKFFINSGSINQPGYLSTASVREISRLNMEIGSHGVRHVRWKSLTNAQLQFELVESRRALEAACGRRVRSAACPFGAYNKNVLRGIKSAGYDTVYTSDGGLVRPGHWIQPRNSMTRGTTIDIVASLLRMGTSRLEQFSIDFRSLIKRNI